MPSVPKPSQAKKSAIVKPAPKSRAAKIATEKKPRTNGEIHIPKNGKMGKVLAAVIAAGGMTRAEIEALSATLDVSPYGIAHAFYMSKRLGMLKD